MQNRNKLEIKF